MTLIAERAARLEVSDQAAEVLLAMDYWGESRDILWQALWAADGADFVAHGYRFTVRGNVLDVRQEVGG